MSTVDTLNTAWDAYMTALAAGDLTALTRARETLYGAAQAHAAQARPLASITGYYAAANNDPGADPALMQELAQELDAMRRATAILDGAWPGTHPIVGG